jgi:hypothetical protein
MKKALFIGIGLLILAFWGDAILGLLEHLVEIILETLELLVDHFLESVLKLAPREAQMVTAWLGFGLFTLILVLVLKKLARVLQRFRIQAPAWWEEEKVRLRAMRSSMGWPLGLIAMVVILVLLYL